MLKRVVVNSLRLIEWAVVGNRESTGDDQETDDVKHDVD